MCIVEFDGFEGQDVHDEWYEATYITEFEEWQNRLNEELSYMINQPATEENLSKIGALVQHFFSDPMFHHDNHEVHVVRLPDGGVSITVAMDYEDTDDYIEDFDLGSDAEKYAVEMTRMEDAIPVNDEDVYVFGVLFNYDPDPEVIHMAEAAYRAAVADAQLQQAQADIVDILKARVEKKAAEALKAQQHERWLDRAHVAMGDAAAEGQPAPVPQSPDDILFAPIVTDEEKKKQEQKKVDENYMYDCGD